MLFRDNLIIRLVLVYRLKQNLHFNKANRSSSISSLDIQLSLIYVQLRKVYKHIFCVFSSKQEFQVNFVTWYFCFSRKGPLREKQKYQVTNLCVKSNIMMSRLLDTFVFLRKDHWHTYTEGGGGSFSPFLKTPHLETPRWGPRKGVT